MLRAHERGRGTSRGAEGFETMIDPSRNAPFTRSHLGALLAALILLFAACGTGAPLGSAQPNPSAAPATNSATAATPSAASSTPTSAPSAPGLGTLPIGRAVVAQLNGNPEGDFLGAYLLGVDGVPAPLVLPVDNVGFAAVWSPDGARLLVTAFTGTQLVVGTLDPATNAYSEIQPKGMTGQMECTDWTADGLRVICSRAGPDPATDGIYTVEIATGVTKRLTKSAFHYVAGTDGECGGGEGRAVYSGDGRRFAYIQQKCGTGPNPSADEQGAIAVASADGSGSKVIVPFGGVRTHPGGEIAWSPTDDRIAFGTQDGRLSIINADGTGLQVVDLPKRGFVYGPAWSPDGKWLLVTMAPDTTRRDELFVVASDGSSMTQISIGPEVEAYTDWGPLP